MEGFPEGKGVFGGAGQHKLVLNHRQRAQIGAFHRSFHQGHIQLAFQQHFFNEPGVVYKDLHLGQGKQLFIPVDDGGEDTGAHRDGGAHPQKHLGGGIAHAALHFIKKSDDVPGIGQKALSLGRDIEFFGQPLKEFDTVAFLHIGNDLADGGLGNIKLFGRQAHFAGFGHGDENAQMTDGHKNRSSLAM